MRTVLVTGASGFIGSRLVKSLLKRGYTVIAAQRRESYDKFQALIKNDSGKGVMHFISVNNTCSDFETELSLSAKEYGLDGVIHLAGQSIVDNSPAETDILLEANFDFGVRVIDSAVRNGARTFINVGTFWEHGLGRQHNFPNCLYAALKSAFGEVLKYYFASKQLDATITLKLFDVYGENDPRGKLLSQLRQAQSEGKAIDLSPGEQKIDLIHIDDVIQALVFAEDQVANGVLSGYQAYSVNTGNFRSLKEIITLIELITGQQIPVQWGARPYRKVDSSDPWRGGNWIPGWQPEIDLESGLRRCFGSNITNTCLRSK